MEQIMEKCKNTKILGAIGVICLALGVILPYLKFSFLGFSESISLFGYWEGKVIILLVIANTLFIFKDFVKKYVPQFFTSPMGKAIENANEKMSLIPTILSAVFAIYLYNSLDLDSSYIKYGIGFWVLWIGIASLIAYAILYKGSNTTANVGTAVPPVQSTNAPVVNPTIQSSTPVNNGAPIKFCANCGNKIDETTNKCTSCGTQY